MESNGFSNMATPDKGPVLNILKKCDAAQQAAPEADWSQSLSEERRENVMDEISENQQVPQDQDQPPKPLDVEEDLTHPSWVSLKPPTTPGAWRTVKPQAVDTVVESSENAQWPEDRPKSLGVDDDLAQSGDTFKPPTTPSAWRTVKKPQETVKFGNYKENEAMEIHLERREREMDRQERELDRRGREIDRRERELERRQREFDRDRACWTSDISTAPQWATAIEALKNKIDVIILKERISYEQREVELEARLMKKVNEALEREHQIMQMSDNEVNEMIEDTVEYLLQKDEDIADRVRFQSLVYLAQEKLATEAGLQPGTTQERLPTLWILALGPSVVTEDRYTKAMDLLKKEDKVFSDATVKLLDCKHAMEFLVEYTSHLKKEGLEQTFTPGRISREAYLESIERQVKQSGVNGEALTIVLDFVCQDLETSVKPSEA